MVSCVCILGMKISERKMQNQIYSFQIRCIDKVDTLEKKKEHSIFILVVEKKCFKAHLECAL